MRTNLLRSISNISVKSLFGLYDYTLDFNCDTAIKDEKIIIFYGDNGSGKSTILKLAFHLLAPGVNQGHKTYLLKTCFKEISVQFNDRTIVKAKRKTHAIGAYELHITRGEKNIASALVTTDVGDADKDLHLKFEPALANLNYTLYFLSDDRAIHRGNMSKSDWINHFENEAFVRDNKISLRNRQIATPEAIAQNLLKSAIERTENWFRSKALGSNTRGDSSVNELYAKILKRISDAGGDKSTRSSKKQVEKRLIQLTKESENFSKYGLLPKLEGKEILQILNTAKARTSDVIVDVLTAYLDSIETKNDAMRNAYERINTFITIAGKFYTNKSLSFNLTDGLQINATNGDELKPEMLSSGERHLLLLFCTSIVAGGSPSILMIDEPEISLNIKWQRMLIDSLLKCIGDNDIQFIFSTHSLEILSKHRSRVVKLENENI